MAVFALSWIFKFVVYIVLLSINMKFVDESVLPVPKDIITNQPFVKILAFPYSPVGKMSLCPDSLGAISAFAWANIVHQAARQLFVDY